MLFSKQLVWYPDPSPPENDVMESGNEVCAVSDTESVQVRRVREKIQRRPSDWQGYVGIGDQRTVCTVSPKFVTSRRLRQSS